MTQLHELLDVFDTRDESSPTTEGPIGYAFASGSAALTRMRRCFGAPTSAAWHSNVDVGYNLEHFPKAAPTVDPFVALSGEWTPGWKRPVLLERWCDAERSTSLYDDTVVLSNDRHLLCAFIAYIDASVTVRLEAEPRELCSLWLYDKDTPATLTNVYARASAPAQIVRHEIAFNFDGGEVSVEAAALEAMDAASEEYRARRQNARRLERRLSRYDRG